MRNIAARQTGGDGNMTCHLQCRDGISTKFVEKTPGRHVPPGIYEESFVFYKLLM